MAISDVQQAHRGISSPTAARKKTAPLLPCTCGSNREVHTLPTRLLMLIRLPHLVRSTPLMAAAKADDTKKAPNNKPAAACRHFTHADRARLISERSRIQIHDPRNSPTAIRALSVSHVPPSIDPWMRNKSKPGTQVTSDKGITRTE